MDIWNKKVDEHGNFKLYKNGNLVEEGKEPEPKLMKFFRTQEEHKKIIESDPEGEINRMATEGYGWHSGAWADIVEGALMIDDKNKPLRGLHSTPDFESLSIDAYPNNKELQAAYANGCKSTWTEVYFELMHKIQKLEEELSERTPPS